FGGAGEPPQVHVGLAEAVVRDRQEPILLDRLVERDHRLLELLGGQQFLPGAKQGHGVLVARGVHEAGGADRGRLRGGKQDGGNGKLRNHGITSHKKRGPPGSGPQYYVRLKPDATNVPNRLELEPDADAQVARRLELGRRARQQRVDRLAEIRIRRARVQLQVLIVVGDALLVEQVEHVREERDLVVAAQRTRPRGLKIELAFERRALHEAVHRLDARATRRGRDFTRARVVRVGDHLRERLAGAEVEAGAEVQAHGERVVAIELDLVRTIERQDAVRESEEPDVARARELADVGRVVRR